MEDAILKIKDNYFRLSKGQKLAADYILSHLNDVTHMSADKIAKNAGVSESTVIRLSSKLGYDSFPAFTQAIGLSLISHPVNDGNDGKETQYDILQAVMEADAKRITDTLSGIDRETFERAQELIMHADTVYILGMRSCEPLAEMLGFYLNIIRGNVQVLKSTSSSEVFEQMIRIRSKDAFIGISFPRYSMRTLKAMEFARDRNASVIAITDSDRSPMCFYSSCMLTAKSNMVSVLDSLVAPLSLINALIVSLCVKNSGDVRNNLLTLEKVWGDYQVYLNDEINFYNDENISEHTQVYNPDEN